MKHKFLLLATALLLGIQSYAQTGIAINNTGADPDNSAMLDVSATNKGILVPRLTQAQRIAIPTPAKGLLVYQNNGTEGFYYYDGAAWVRMASGTYTETDPVVKSINGLVKSDGTTISAAAAGTDYLTPTGSAASLTNFPTLNQNTTGTAANVTGTVAITNGGTGSSIQNFVDLYTDQNIGGNKTFNGNTTFGGTLNLIGGTSFWAPLRLNTLIPSRPLFTDDANYVVSNPVTGTGNVVMSNSPTMVTPALGVATATSINGLTLASQPTGFTIAGGTTSKTMTVASDASVSGTNTGDNAVNTLYSGLVSNATHTGDAEGATELTVKKINGVALSGLSTGILKNTTATGVPTIAVAADFPILNQNSTGTAANVTGTVAIANGGTGATTKTAAFNALSPMTAPGDIIYGGSGGTGTALPKGTTGQVLTMNSGATAPEWTTPTNGTVTSVTGTSPIVSSGGTTPAISIPAATSTSSGYLSDSDWNSFNGKESALTFSSPLSRSTNTISLGTIPIANGGTGETTASGAINALLPAQGSNTGKYLTTNGSTALWGSLVSSQWVTSGSDIYYPTGKVGIGMATPESIGTAPLNVEGGILYKGGNTGPSTPGLLYYDNGTGNGVFKYIDKNATEQILGTGSISYSGTLWTTNNNDYYSNDYDVVCSASLGVGYDITPGQAFGFSTIILKENILRITFDDSSNTPGFPDNDWQLTANESASQGKEYFAIEDITNSKIPFMVMAQAPTNSLYIGSTGNVGFGTSTPARKVHISDAMRLEPTTEPTTPAAGDLYFDSTSNKLRCFDGTTWHDLW